MKKTVNIIYIFYTVFPRISTWALINYNMCKRVGALFLLTNLIKHLFLTKTIVIQHNTADLEK